MLAGLPAASTVRARTKPISAIPLFSLRPALLFSGLLLLFGLSCSTAQKASSASSPTPTEILAAPPAGAFDFTEIAQDPSYGYSADNPIMVGGANDSEGPSNERRFLKCLSGPNGEPLEFERERSCCGFDTENSPFGSGLLDIYLIRWEGQSEPVQLYINMYDYAPLKVPQGFTRR